jgi:hypothetical protein
MVFEPGDLELTNASCASMTTTTRVQAHVEARWVRRQSSRRIGDGYTMTRLCRHLRANGQVFYWKSEHLKGVDIEAIHRNI